MPKNQSLVIVILLIISTLAVSVFFTRINTANLAKPKITYADITENYIDIFFTPRDFTAETGEVLKIHPVISTKNQRGINFVQLTINFNQDLLEFINIDDQTLDSGFIPANSESGNPNQTGQIILKYETNNSQKASENSVDFSTLVFTLKNDQPSDNLLTFDLTNSEVVFNDQTRAFLNLNSKTTLNYR